MTTSEARRRRIGDRMREELAEILLRQVDDPRLAGLTVTGVEVDRELAYATVHVTALEGSARQRETVRALIRARGFFRSALAQRIPLRTFPQLRFRWDASAERGARIDELLQQIQRPAGETADDADAG